MVLAYQHCWCRSVFLKPGRPVQLPTRSAIPPGVIHAPLREAADRLSATFAGLGERKAAYILVYGLLVVPLETALVASFFRLAGGLLISLLASLYMTFTNLSSKDPLDGFPAQEERCPRPFRSALTV